MNALVYTDGSGLASRGPGGVGYAGYLDGVPVEGSRGLPTATNQQAEVLAAAYALAELPPCEYVRVVSDSEYVVKGMTEWVDGWVARGWRTNSRGPVKNRPHWERLLAAAGRHGTVRFRWVRGHNGSPLNERADRLAVAARHLAEGLPMLAEDERPAGAPWRSFLARVRPDLLLGPVGDRLPARERETLEEILVELDGTIVEAPVLEADALAA